MDSEVNRETNLNPEPLAPPAVPPAAGSPATNPGGSRILTIGILMAAVALGVVFIKQDSKVSQAVGQGSDKPSAMKIGEPAPKLVLKDLDGKTVDLAQLRGKVVLVDFWATWCEPCGVMIPWFIDFHNHYASRGLEIVGVAMDDEGIEAVKPFALKNKMNYVIVLGNEDTAQAWGGIFGLPTSFIIDRKGNVKSRHVGLISKKTFQDDIEALL